MEQQIFIYALEDHTYISSTVYVGYTIDPDKRLKRHLEEATSNRSERNRYRNCWIRSLLNRGVMPKMIILEEIKDGDWQEAEKYHIAYFKSIGMKLCNDTEGGDGTLGHKHTDESKEKMRQAKIGIPKTEEWKQSISRQDIIEDIDCIIEMYNSGYSLREIGELYDAGHDRISYQIQKAGIELREEKFTDRSKDKLREANVGKVQSAETRQKRSASLTGRTRPQEVCEKISATRKQRIAAGQIKMPVKRASGEDSGKYRKDIDNSRLIELFNKGLSFRAIGKEVGLEHHSVKARLKKAGAIT